MPLDVRVRQHEAVLREKMLDPNTTVSAISPPRPPPPNAFFLCRR
jgi:hypothetical protein